MIADEKLRVIRQILDNKVYMLDSGMYQIVEQALNKLSLGVLQSLLLIIQNKTVS
jgi:hypothetical protein